jgi:pimeloyl-ACP methyl ester carboxylesterase
MPNRAVLDQLNLADVVVTGGRALIIPIWPAQYQRVVPTTTDVAVLADQQTRAVVQSFQDGVRTIDYLGTRRDMDVQRVGFMAISFGGIVIAPPLLAMEGRVRAAVLLSSGVWLWGAAANVPSRDIVHYAPRIRMPVLMINGRYDSMLPLESSQMRLFELLGTPAADKRQVLFDTSHFMWSHSQVAKEVNDWFDTYLGPVK